MPEVTSYIPTPMPELSFCNENGTLRVTGGLGGSLRSYVPFAQTVEVLNRYECGLVDLTVYAGDVIDFEKIKRPDRIRRLSVNFFEKNITCSIPDATVGLTGLVELTVTGTFPKQFLDFSKLPELKVLDIDYKNQHLSWLQHTGLLEVKVRGCSAPDLAEFSGLTSLKRLRLLRGSIASLNGIELMPNLDTLFTYSTQKLLEIQALTRSRSLRNIMFEASKKITNWDFLMAMPELRWLNVEVADSVRFVSQLPNLIHVHVAQKILDGDRTPIDQHPSIIRGIKEQAAARAAGGEAERAYKLRFQEKSPWRHLIDWESLLRDTA